jgi:hypothetical protein
MPDVKKTKKKGVLTIPPELQEYIKGEKFGGGFGAGYPFSPETEMWGELSPSKVYDFWAQNTPEELYLLQLRDYLAEVINPNNTSGRFLRDVDGTPITDPDKAFARAGEIFKEAQAKVNSGFYPVETLPYYEESKNVMGANFKREYENTLINETQIAQQEAVARQEALGNVYSRQGRQTLQGLVGEGVVTGQEAFGSGSAWEKWQHEQVGADTANIGLQMRNVQSQQAREAQIGESANLSNQRLQEQVDRGQLKANLYPDWLKKFEAEFNAGYGGGMGGGGLQPGQQLGAGRFVIPAGGEGGTAEGGGGGSTTGATGGGAYRPSYALYQGFANWDTPEFDQYRQKQDVQYTQDYPNTYPVYQNLLNRGQVNTPFETWLSQDPVAKLLSDQEAERKRLASGVAKTRLTPITVNR